MRMYAEIFLNKPVAAKRPMENPVRVNFAFPNDYYIEQHAQVLLLTHIEVDLVMLRSIMPTAIIEEFKMLHTEGRSQCKGKDHM